MYLKSARWIVGAGLLAVGSSAWASPVPITYLDEIRSVSASSFAFGLTRAGTNSAPHASQQNQSQQANGLADFNGDVSAQSSLGPQSAGASGTAMQQSSLDGSGFSASGSITADSVLGIGGQAHGASTSVFDITFNVAQAESYTFNATLSGMTDPGSPQSTLASIKLTTLSGKNVFAPLSTIRFTNFSTQGTLAAGTYVFAMNLLASSGDENFDSINYNISLLDGPAGTSPADGINGLAPATGVPQLSSGLSSAVMLSTLGALALVRRRRAALAKIAVR